VSGAIAKYSVVEGPRLRGDSFSSGQPCTDYRYTGRREIGEIGLYFDRARGYDPALRRFVQAESLVCGTASPLVWDRYSQVRNNPLSHRWAGPTVPVFHGRMRLP
jgi:RHS repeat-associated protein